MVHVQGDIFYLKVSTCVKQKPVRKGRTFGLLGCV